jgi:uncharacterized protein
MRTMHFEFKPLIGFLLVIFLFCSPVFAAEPNIVGQVTLSDTERFTLAAENIEQTFQIDVSFPLGYQVGSEDYPVVYLLDGNSMFPVVDNNLKGLQLGAEIPGIILVAIGYELENEMEAFILRTRDLVPTFDAVWTEEMRNAPAPNGLPENISPGGADEFLNFINNELKPVINARYRVDASDQTLAGYSFGGLFSLFTLFNHPDSFDRYVIGSPSIWWHEQVSFDYEEQYAQTHSDLAKTVFISSGGLEEPPGSEAFAMVSNAREMERRLRARGYPNLQLEYLIFDGETHMSGYGVSTNRGLKAVFAND